MNELEDMIRAIEADLEYSRHEIGKASIDPKVMEAIRSVPRDKFVTPEHKDHAYDNRPLPIGHGQTISQPYIVALMTDLLQSKESDVILDIGTGSGYQAAILSRLVKQVYGIEIVDKLASQAAARLRRLGHTNVQIRSADGYYGWPEHAPFDGIIVAAASPVIPPPLIEQLKPGGRLVIPLGQPLVSQTLVVLEKGKDGINQTRNIVGVVFVPLTGGPTSES